MGEGVGKGHFTGEMGVGSDGTSTAVNVFLMLVEEAVVMTEAVAVVLAGQEEGVSCKGFSGFSGCSLSCSTVSPMSTEAEKVILKGMEWGFKLVGVLVITGAAFFIINKLLSSAVRMADGVNGESDLLSLSPSTGEGESTEMFFFASGICRPFFKLFTVSLESTTLSGGSGFSIFTSSTSSKGSKLLPMSTVSHGMAMSSADFTVGRG